MEPNKPWEQPRIKRVLELFGGRVTKIQSSNRIQKEAKVNEEDIQRLSNCTDNCVRL